MRTPGPWGTKEGMIYSESDQSGKTIVFCDNKANADFIVRACNAHDDLLHACDIALENLQQRSKSRMRWTMRDQTTFETLERVIFKARV